jgi:molybdenum cofactor synthesis domain-containing protein
MSAEAHRKMSDPRVKVAVLTVSDTRTLDDDASGDALAARLTHAGHELVARRIVRDEPADVRRAIEAMLAAGARVVITTGGTGISARDATYEAVAGLLEKRLDGFGELFRALSYAQIGPAAMMSRAVAGTCRGGLVVALPGSLDAVTLALTKLLLPELPHLAKLAARAGAATKSASGPTGAATTRDENTSTPTASDAVVVRDAQANDLDAAARLAVKLVRFHQALDPARYLDADDLEQGYRRWFAKELTQPERAVLLVAERAGAVVGYAYGRLEGADWNLLLAEHGALHDVWVEPEARRGGVATRLVSDLCARLTRLGAPRVLLHSAWQNTEAHALFERLGFRRTMVEMTREADGNS